MSGFLNRQDGRSLSTLPVRRRMLPHGQLGCLSPRSIPTSPTIHTSFMVSGDILASCTSQKSGSGARRDPSSTPRSGLALPHCCWGILLIVTRSVLHFTCRSTHHCNTTSNIIRPVYPNAAISRYHKLRAPVPASPSYSCSICP